MKATCIVLFLCSVVAVTSSYYFPKYLKKCKDDASLNNCVLTNANDVLPTLLKGDEKLGIPSFEPFLMPELFIFGSPENLQINTTRVKYYGLPECTVTDASWDVNNQKTYFKISCSKLQSKFDYTIDGTFLNRTFSGEGPGTVNAGYSWFTFNMSYSIQNVKGKHFAQIQDTKVDYHIESGIFDLENLSDTEGTPESDLNNLLNTNWQNHNVLIKEDFIEFNTILFKTVMDPIFKEIPIDKLFH